MRAGHSDAVRPAVPAIPTDNAAPLQVVLVFDVPAGTAETAYRTAALADEFADRITAAVPGVRARGAVVAPAVARVRIPAPARGLHIDRRGRRVLVDGVAARLTYREFELLCTLAAAPHRAVSREELLATVWQGRHDVSTRTVDTHMSRLRVKLGPYAQVLTTVRGLGYRFEPVEGVRYLS